VELAFNDSLKYFNPSSPTLLSMREIQHNVGNTKRLYSIVLWRTGKIQLSEGGIDFQWFTQIFHSVISHVVVHE